MNAPTRNIIVENLSYGEGTYSECCSLADVDHMESISFSYDAVFMGSLLESIKQMQQKFGRHFAVDIENLVTISILNKEDEEIDPQYMELYEIQLHTKGYIEAKFESRYGADDFWRVDFPALPINTSL